MISHCEKIPGRLFYASRFVLAGFSTVEKSRPNDRLYSNAGALFRGSQTMSVRRRWAGALRPARTDAVSDGSNSMSSHGRPIAVAKPHAFMLILFSSLSLHAVLGAAADMDNEGKVARKEQETSYPTRPVRFIIPFPPSGGTADNRTKAWRQTGRIVYHR